MMEQSGSSIWAATLSWFTPMVLFVLINVVVGTIFIFSSSQKKQETDGSNQLARTSSAFERFRSFNLYRQRTLDPITAQDPQPQETIGTVESITDPEPEAIQEPEATQEPEAILEPPEAGENAHLARIQSDTHPMGGELPEKLPQKMKKSASAKSAFGHFHEEEIVAVGRPSTVRERKLVREDSMVDDKADDFINRFKQQLKLQRMDSILRYKEMLNRGK